MCNSDVNNTTFGCVTSVCVKEGITTGSLAKMARPLLVTMVVWAGLLTGVVGQDPAVEAAQLGGMKLSELSSWLSERSEVAEAYIY